MTAWRWPAVGNIYMKLCENQSAGSEVRWDMYLCTQSMVISLTCLILQEVNAKSEYVLKLNSLSKW
jgi:hypothetical protein